MLARHCLACVLHVWHAPHVAHGRAAAQVPSRDDLAYLNAGGVRDSVHFPRLRMRSLPISHSKSPTRWRTVRSPPPTLPRTWLRVSLRLPPRWH